MEHYEYKYFYIQGDRVKEELQLTELSKEGWNPICAIGERALLLRRFVDLTKEELWKTKMKPIFGEERLGETK